MSWIDIILIRMMNRLLVTILVVSQLGLALQPVVHTRENHFATDEVYQNGLVKLEQELIKTMDALKSQLSNDTQEIQTKRTTEGKDWKALDTKVDDEFDALTKVEEYIKVPLSPKPCNTTA